MNTINQTLKVQELKENIVNDYVNTNKSKISIYDINFDITEVEEISWKKSFLYVFFFFSLISLFVLTNYI